MRSVRLSAQTKIVKAENRIKTLDDIIANLYEDNVTGKISDERFDLLAKKYEAEQTALKSEIVELKKALDLVNDEESNIREFLKVVNSYTEIEELTPEILNNFIDRIYIGNKSTILHKGIVCDKCNNYFARKVEQPFLESEPIRKLRQELQLENKKGKTIAEYQYPKIGDNQVKQISDNSFLFYGNRGTYSRNTE